MSYESPFQKPCPRCSISFNMPQPYDSGQKKHPPTRQCACAPDQVSVAYTLETGVDKSVKDAVVSLENKLNEQARFIELLLHMVPRSMSVPESYSPPYNAGLDGATTTGLEMLDEEFLKRMVASAVKNDYAKPEDEGAKYQICLICGNSNSLERLGKKPSEIGIVAICYACGVMQKNHPDVFSWIWRIIRWNHYAWSIRPAPPQGKGLERNIITE